jgi:septum site-determining protein MinD
MLAEGKTLIITFHSYKGGTGKTLLSVNLATILAARGKKTCLLDLDFSAPSLHTIFKNAESNFWLNDFLNRGCEIDKVLRCCDSDYVAKGKLFVGLANPSCEATREMSSKDRKWEMQALCRLLSLKSSLLDKLDFDHVILDTSPGLQYSSINAIFSADVTFVVVTLDRSDIEGTRFMIKDLYKFFEKKIEIILNKVPSDFNNSRMVEITRVFPKVPLIGVIPCSCDVLKAEGEYFFASKKPHHVLTRTLQKIATKIN